MIGNFEGLHFALFAEMLFLLGVEALDQRDVVRLLLFKVNVQTVSSVLSGLLLLGQSLDLLVLVAELGLHLLLLLHELLNGVVLVELKAGTKFNSFVELGDLRLKLTDDLTGLFFLFLGGLDELPSFVDFFLKKADGRAVLLGQLDSSFDTRGILNDNFIQIFDLSDKTLLRVVGSLKGTVKFFVFGLKPLHGLFADH